MNNYIERIPLLRVLLPLIAGLCLYSIFDLSYIICLSIILILIISVLCNKKFPICKDILIYTSIILISYLNTTLRNSTNESVINNDCNIVARIDKIIDNESSMKVNASIVETINGCKNHTEYNKKITLTIQGNDYLLHPGNLILFENRLSPIKNMSNPEEFDYKTYCNHLYLYNQQFLYRNEYKIIGESHTLTTYCSFLKNKLTKFILSNHFLDENSQNFLITILLGSKEYFNSNIKESFVNIGLAHILALSGLHVAIIAYFIYLILFPLDYIINKKYRIGLTVIILALYAMLTGLSASVSRATLLFAFGFIALRINRKINSYNILCAIAIILLIINPNNLYDVGFQLSFVAVLSILIFTYSFRQFELKNSIARYILNLIIISISAVIGTGIISAFYFNNLPVLFIIPNLIIVPLLPIILSIGVCALLFNSSLLSNIFNTIYNTIEQFVKVIDNLPYSNIDYIYVTQIILVIYFIIIFTCIYYLYKRKILISTIILICGIVLIVVSLNVYKPINNSLIIFNSYNSTPILIQEEESATLMPTITNEDLNEFKKYHKRYISKYHLTNLSIYNGDTQENHIINPNIVQYNGKNIRIITSSKDNENELNIPVDYLVITKKYYSNIYKLIEKYKPKLVILSGDIYEKQLEKLIKDLDKIGTDYYNIREKGAFIMH